jgi:hypothetical protein
MATAANTPRPWLRPRFGLRLLLLAFTAFAVGFPIWYRWPYEEREVAEAGVSRVERITTWQRQWGGGRLKRGPERHTIDGVIFRSTNYRDGRKHGPHTEYTLIDGADSRGLYVIRSPHPTEVGQYADDEEVGPWMVVIWGEPRFFVHPNSPGQ